MDDKEQQYWNNEAGKLVKIWGYIGLLIGIVGLIKMFVGIWS